MTAGPVVFDCMVFVQAIASKGPAFRCYQHVAQRGQDLLVSEETLRELRTVLDRPELQRKLPGITPERVDALMHHLAELAVLVCPVPIWLPFPADPKDEPYVNLAIEGKAQSLVTRDKALLQLSNPCNPLFPRLQSLHFGLQIHVPEDFLARAGISATPAVFLKQTAFSS